MSTPTTWYQIDHFQHCTSTEWGGVCGRGTKVLIDDEPRCVSHGAAKKRCNSCDQRVPEVLVTQVSRKSGGNYRRAQGRSDANICRGCVERLLPSTTRRGVLSVSNWSLSGLRLAGERFGLEIPERDPDPREAQRAAQAALQAAGNEELLKKAYALTHRMDQAHRFDNTPGRARAEEADLRAQRDLITAEILRRMG